MNFLFGMVLLATGLSPARTWYQPSEPVTINVSAGDGAQLVLTDFNGTRMEPTGSDQVSGEKAVDLKTLYPRFSNGNAFILYLVPKGKSFPEFEGTPLVIEVRAEQQAPPGAGPDVIKVEPLRYAVIHTPRGNMTAIFYYDVAPVTVDNFLGLASEGFYDGLTFHRIVPGFVLQGGDPKGDGSGGPGYTIPQEFNDRKHEEGVLSMARRTDPNSGGSQFFICLDYNQTKHLDHQYTAFGRVVEGMKLAHEIEKTPLADPQSGRPTEPQVIEKIEVKNVDAGNDPYAAALSPAAEGGAK